MTDSNANVEAALDIIQGRFRKPTKMSSFTLVASKLKQQAAERFEKKKKHASIKLKPDQIKALLARKDESKSTSVDEHDSFDFSGRGNRGSIGEEKELHKLGAETEGDESRGDLFVLKTSRFAQMKCLFLKESEEVYMLRQTLSDLRRYMTRLQKELTALRAKLERQQNSVEAMRADIVVRTKQLTLYGFNASMRYPFELVSSQYIAAEQLRVQSTQECIRVVNTRVFESETLMISVALRIEALPENRRSRSGWAASFKRSPTNMKHRRASTTTGSSVQTPVSSNEVRPDVEGLCPSDPENAHRRSRSTVPTPGDEAFQLTERTHSEDMSLADASEHNVDSAAPVVELDFYKMPHVLVSSDPIVASIQDELRELRRKRKATEKNLIKPMTRYLRSRNMSVRRGEIVRLFKSKCVEDVDEINPSVSACFKDASGAPMPFEDVRQCLFDAIVCDQRTREGRLLERWRLRLNEGDALLPPCTIVAFCNYFEQLVVARYGLDEEGAIMDAPNGPTLLRDLCRNMIFLRLHAFCITYNHANISKKNQLWQERVAWMKGRSQENMFLAECYQVKDQDVPYGRSIALFERIKPCCTPNSMTAAMLEGIKAVHEEAKAATGKAIGGMEDLFPVLVYVLVQADLPDIHKYLAYLENFSDGNGEAGFYLCSMQACVAWVLDQRSLGKKGSEEIGEEVNIDPTDEEAAIISAPLAIHVPPLEEEQAVEALQRWMIGADMSEDTYEMLL